MRITKSISVGNVGDEFIHYIEGSCDSSETKPTENIGDGSIMVESDTGDVYFFNEKSEDWVKQFSFQG